MNSPSTVSEDSGVPGPLGAAERHLARELDNEIGMEAGRKGVLSYSIHKSGLGAVKKRVCRAVGEELGDLVWGGGTHTLPLAVHLEEHLLLSLFLVSRSSSRA